MGRTRRRDRHLPACMYLKHGAYYFQNTKTRKWEPLGADLGAALSKYLRRTIGNTWSGRTLGDVIDRYRIEVLPVKGEHSRMLQGPQLDRLKRVFGDMLPDSVTAQDCYRYMDARRTKDGEPAPSAAQHEIALLGHVFAKANRWGVGIGNPVRQLEKAKKPRRTRYVTDGELAQVRKFATERMDIAIEGALLTALRRGDLLTLTRAHLTDDGILVPTSKTGIALLIEWTDALHAWVERTRRLAPQVPGTYLIRTREGKPYTAAGFAANWKRTMAKAVATGMQPFTFQDIRAKSSDDTLDETEAQQRLGHASVQTTRRHYRTKPRRVRPLR